MISIIKDRVAIRMIQDPHLTPGKVTYTEAEKRIFEELGGFKTNTSAKLLVPDAAIERADQGIVKYIGPDVQDIKIGDYVLFGGYDGVVINLEDEGAFLLIREEYIKCRVENVNTEVYGLFFQSKPDWEGLGKTLGEFLPDLNSVQTGTVLNLVRTFMFQTYFQATHEQAVELIAQAWEDHPLNIRTKNKIDDRSKSIKGET